MSHINKLVLAVVLAIATIPVAHSADMGRVVVVDFQLNDLTDLPNAPEELKRISYLSSTFRQRLAESGVRIIEPGEQLKNEVSGNSPTYLFDRPEVAARLASDSGAEFVLIGVALKPTYLFVYPRLLMVDIRTGKVVMSKYAQLESSWTDQNTTANTARSLADKVLQRLVELK